MSGRIEGSLARKLDFGDMAPARSEQPGLRLAPSPRELRGPHKYRILDHRRHQAQIRARRALEQAEETS